MRYGHLIPLFELPQPVEFARTVHKKTSTYIYKLLFSMFLFLGSYGQKWKYCSFEENNALATCGRPCSYSRLNLVRYGHRCGQMWPMGGNEV